MKKKTKILGTYPNIPAAAQQRLEAALTQYNKVREDSFVPFTVFGLKAEARLVIEYGDDIFVDEVTLTSSTKNLSPIERYLTEYISDAVMNADEDISEVEKARKARVKELEKTSETLRKAITSLGVDEDYAQDIIYENSGFLTDFLRAVDDAINNAEEDRRAEEQCRLDALQEKEMRGLRNTHDKDLRRKLYEKLKMEFES